MGVHNDFQILKNAVKMVKRVFFVFILCDLFLNSAYRVITQDLPFEVCKASVTYLHENINDESEI